MDLRDYLRILHRNWILVTALTLLGLLAGAAATLLTQPTYTSQTRLFVALLNSGSVSELQQGNTFSQSRVVSYVKTVDSPAVLQPVIDSLGLKTTPAELAEHISASSEPNTVLISIAVSDRSPVQAAAIAKATADSLIATVDSLETPESSDSSPIRLSVITPASAPALPSAPNTGLNLMAGLAVGIFLGVGASILRSTLDTRIRSEADLRQITDAPVLGAIAFDTDATKKPLLTQAAPQSPRAESFRQLRTNLQFANISANAASILVTSSVPGEGKSTTATNLAIALAEAGQAVCLIDADLRRPMVNEYLGLDRSAGLTTALVGAADVDDLLQPWGDDKLFVLTSGQVPPNPSELLGSEQMHELLTRLQQVFDAIVIDAPPLLPVTDAAVLSRHTGGVVLVVGTQKVKRQEFQKSLDSLAMVGSAVLGVVLNRLPSKGPDAYGYGSYSYSQDSDNTGRRERDGKTHDMSSTETDEFSRILIDTRANPAQLFPGDRSKSDTQTSRRG